MTEAVSETEAQDPVRYVVNERQFIQNVVDALQKLPVTHEVHESLLRPILLGFQQRTAPLPPELEDAFEASVRELNEQAERKQKTNGTRRKTKRARR